MAFWSKKPPSPPDDKAVPAAGVAEPAHTHINGAAQSAPQPAQDAIMTDTPAPPSAAHAPDLSAEELAKRRAMSRHISATFGEIVSVLMRQQSSRHNALSDLEWMVVPALMSNQFSVAEAQSKAQGFVAPISLLLWARVSPDVDQRLSNDLERPLRLTPAEWTSGDTIWIVEACGEPRALQAMLRKVQDERWKGHTVKFRSKGPDGKPVVRTLGHATAPDVAAG